jgi:hypothetical protein
MRTLGQGSFGSDLLVAGMWPEAICSETPFRALCPSRSPPALASALEVLAANGVEVMLAEGDEYTPIPRRAT